MLLARGNTFHVTDPNFSDLEPALSIDLIKPWKGGVIKTCLWLSLVRPRGYVTVSWFGCVAGHRR